MRLNQDQLAKAMFPIGHLPKPEVRRIAEEAGLATAKKKDSTGVCFIGERNFKEFLSGYLPAQPGDMIDIASGEAKGRHDGLMYYTLGQRQGLGIGGSGNGEPWFVADKDLEGKHSVCRARRRSIRACIRQLDRNRHQLDRARQTGGPVRCTAKFRYRQADQGVTVDILTRTARPQKSFSISRRKPITPGQAVVFYDGDVCLGGGTIDIVTK